MKKFLIAFAAVALVFGVASCSQSSKATNEVLTYFKDGTKSIKDATNALNNATDAKGAIAALDKYVTFMKGFQTKGEDLQKKYADVDIKKSKEADVEKATEEFGNEISNFVNAMTAVAGKYSDDPDFAAKLQEIGNMK